MSHLFYTRKGHVSLDHHLIAAKLVAIVANTSDHQGQHGHANFGIECKSVLKLLSFNICRDP